MDIREQLQRDEGIQFHPYVDTVGKTTIGVGRNLIDKGITADEAYILLQNDIAEVEANLRHRLPWFDSLNTARQGVLTNMAFNMGFNGLEEFTKMLAAAAQGNWIEASQEMLNSQWAKQVGDRSRRLAEQMITGAWV